MGIEEDTREITEQVREIGGGNNNNNNKPPKKPLRQVKGIPIIYLDIVQGEEEAYNFVEFLNIAETSFTEYPNEIPKEIQDKLKHIGVFGVPGAHHSFWMVVGIAKDDETILYRHMMPMDDFSIKLYTLDKENGNLQ